MSGMHNYLSGHGDGFKPKWNYFQLFGLQEKKTLLLRASAPLEGLENYWSRILKIWPIHIGNPY